MLNTMRSMNPLALMLASILALTAFAPLAASHAAPAPRDFETRILHDHNDDSLVVLAGKHGFDSIALDAREGRTAAGMPILVLRLLLNGGCDANLPSDCPELSQVVRFAVDGTEHSITFATTDGGETWNGDAAKYVGPFGLNDGTRFAIEAWVPMGPLGIAPGSVLTDWFVEGHSGSDTADNMPEGAVVGAPDPLGAAFDLGSYTVGEPDIYVSLGAETSEATAAAGTEVRFPVEVSNLLGIEQEVLLQVLGTPESRIELDGAQIQSVSLAANFTKTVEVVVTGPETSSPVVLVATTALGGFAAMPFSIQVETEQVEGNGMVDSPDVPVGTTWSHTFTLVGTFSYHNHHLPGQMGTIVVTEATDDASAAEHAVTRDDSGFTPATLTIQQGDTVTWTNSASSPLRVMGGYEEMHGEHPHGEHDDHDHDNDAPATPLVLVGLALLAAVVVTRRSGRS